MASILKLPQELRDQILNLVLEDVKVLVLSCFCRRNLFGQGTLLNIDCGDSSASNDFTKTYRVQYVVCSNIFAVSRQIRIDAIDAVKRLKCGHVFLATSPQQAMRFLNGSPEDVRMRISDLLLAEHCNCRPASPNDSQELLTDAKFACIWSAAYLDRFIALKRVTLLVPTSIVLISRELRQLYLKFLDSLEQHRLEQITVILGYAGHGNYKPDLDYEYSWLLGQPRRRLAPHESHHDHQIREIARLKAMRNWLDISIKTPSSSQSHTSDVTGAQIVFTLRRLGHDHGFGPSDQSANTK